MSDIHDNQSQPPLPSPPRLQFSMRGLLVIVGVLCAVCALVFGAIRGAREADRKARCEARLQSIGLGVCQYYDAYGSFPLPYSSDAAGKPINSWRVLVGDFLGDFSLNRHRYDASLPWNNPANLAISRLDGNQFLFQCPSAPHPGGNGYTDYVMVLSDNATLTPGRAPSATEHRNQFIIVEIAGSDIYWTEPRDLVLGEMRIQINGEFTPGATSGHAHRAVVFNEEDVPRTISLHGRRATFYVTDYTLESKKATGK